MKRRLPSILSQAVNRQAHMLAQQASTTIRQRLEDQARAMLADGKGIEATLQVILTARIPEP